MQRIHRDRPAASPERPRSAAPWPRRRHRWCRHGAAALLAAGSLAVLVSCSSGGGDGEDPAVAPTPSFPVGTSGRIIEYTPAGNADVQLSMTVPAGAVPDGTVVTVEPLPETPGMVPGTVFEFGPDGIEIPATVELAVRYDPATLATDESLLSIHKWVEDTWQALPSTVYPSAHTVVAQLDGFSRYGVGPVITTATPGWGHYLTAIEVVLACDDGSGSPCRGTYYTTDGTVPTAASAKYTAPIPIATATALKFFSVDSAGNPEPPRLATYSIETGQEWDRPTTTATPGGGNHTAPLTVELACDDGGGSGCAATYFVTDDSPLTTASPVYSTPISIDTTTTLRFFSVDNDGNRERAVQEYYRFGPDQDTTPPVSSATPPGGAYGARQYVALECDDNGGAGCAAIYYTVTGEEPTPASPIYRFPVPVFADLTLKFFAEDRLGNREAVHTETYEVDPTHAPYTVGGTVSGLDGTLVLQNNGGDDLTLTADGRFTFATALGEAAAFSVEVAVQPVAQTCSVAGGVGSSLDADTNRQVTDVQVTCVSNRRTVGGTVTGLAGTLVLQNNGTDDLTLTADGPFTFATPVADAGSYAVTVLDAPVAQSCTVANGAGTANGADVTGVVVTCAAGASSYTVTGTVSGLAGTLVLQNNGADDLTLTADGPFAFSTPLGTSATYSVQVLSQPAAQTCAISNGTGGAADGGVTVRCAGTADLAAGQAVFGPIADGAVAIYDVADLSTPVHSGTTSNDSDLALAGRIQVDTSGLSGASLYLVVVTGGQALDFDRDGVHDGMTTSLSGSVHALIPGSQLSAGGWLVSEVTEAAYRSARYLLQADYDTATVIQSLDSSARGLLTADRSGDGVIDHLDLALWHPVTHSESTRMPAATRDIIVEEIRTGVAVRDLAEEAAGRIRSLPLGDVAAVEVAGGIAYVVIDEPCSLQVVDVSSPRTADVVGNVNITGGCQWLSDLEVVGNTVFAVGEGLHVIDVTDPAAPTVVGSHYLLPGSDADIGSSSIRVRGTTAFITPYGSWSTGRGGTLMAVDVSDPAAPFVLDTFFPDLSYNFGSLEVQVAGNTAYLVIGDYSDQQPIVDVSDPAAMVQAGTLSLGSSGQLPEHLAVAGDYLYAVEPYRMVIADISTPGSPQVVGEFVPPFAVNMGQNLSGAVEVVGGLAYVGGNERIYVVDVTTPASPRLIGHVPAPSGGGAPSGFDIVGGLAYAGDIYSGLQILDITDPGIRGVIGEVPLESRTLAIEALGSTAYVADGTGLSVVDLSAPASPQVTGVVPQADLLGGDPELALDPAGEFLFYGAWSSLAGGLNVIDVSTSGAPAVVAQHPEYPQVKGLAMGESLYLAYHPIAYYPARALNKFQALDATNPGALTARGDLDSSRDPRGLAVGPGRVATEMLYFYYNTCSSPPDYASVLLGQEVTAEGQFLIAGGELPNFVFPTGECLGDVAVTGDVALVTTRGDFGNHLYALDVSSTTSIQYLDHIDALSNAKKRLKAVDGTAYVAAANAGVLIADVGLDGTLTPAALLKTPGVALDVAVTGTYVAIADGDALRVMRLPVQTVP